MHSEKVLPEATLCFLCKDNEVLLARKTRSVGKGCFNGYGGGIQQGEDPKKATVREIFEECGAKAVSRDLKKIGVVYSHTTKYDGTVFLCKVHVYVLYKWKGEIKESEEMIDPTWFRLEELPLEQMMPADPYWVPQALSGKKIIATIYYGPFQKELLEDVLVQEVHELEGVA